MNHSLRRYNPECSGEEGNAILELAICLPFMLVILMASVDLGRALNQYLTITRIVYEATRLGASVASLETGTHDLTNVGTVPVGHMAIRERVEVLLDVNNLNWAQVTKLESTLVDTGGRLEVKVEMDLAFDTMFYQLGFMNVLGKAEATGPYLYLGT